MGDVGNVVKTAFGIPVRTRKTGKRQQAVEAAELAASERPGTGDRRRRSRRGRRGGRGATVLASGQDLGIANIALKRLTGA